MLCKLAFCGRSSSGFGLAIVQAERIIDPIGLLEPRLTIPPHTANLTAMRVISNQFDQQMGIPEDQRQAMAKIDDMLIKAGVTTPQELAVLLDRLRPDGTLRKYSQALWNCLSMTQPALSGAHDWAAIYRGESEPAGAETSPAEMIRSLEAEIEKVRTDAMERERSVLQQVSDMLNQAIKAKADAKAELMTELQKLRREDTRELKTLREQLAALQAEKDSLQILADECGPIKAQLVESQIEKNHLRVLAENAKHHLGAVVDRIGQIQRTTLNVMIAIHIGLCLAWPWVFIKEESLWSSTQDATTMERWIWCAVSMAGWGITEIFLLFFVSNDSVTDHGGFFMACLSWIALGFIYMTCRKGKDERY